MQYYGLIEAYNVSIHTLGTEGTSTTTATDHDNRDKTSVDPDPI
jgi:hypothetical protein